MTENGAWKAHLTLTFTASSEEEAADIVHNLLPDLSMMPHFNVTATLERRGSGIHLHHLT